MRRKRPVDEATLRELAVEASVDPRSVAKALRGEPVRGLAGNRINAVLDAFGVSQAALPILSSAMNTRDIAAGLPHAVPEDANATPTKVASQTGGIRHAAKHT